MRKTEPAKLLRLHFSERDRHHGRPLYEAIVQRCRELHIAGATVFRGMEGYGETADIERRPIVVTIVDTADNIDRLIPELEALMDTGFIVASDVESIRIENPTPA
jgi:PII-like signaling protein